MEIFIFLISIILGVIYPKIAFKILIREENLKLEEYELKNTKISLIYLYSLVMTSFTYIVLFNKLYGNGYLPFYLAITTILIIASITDLRWQLIPDSIILFGIFLFFIIGFLTDINLKYRIFNGITSFLVFYILYRIYPEGFGGGDVKVIGVLGLYFSLIELINILTYSSLIGILYLVFKKIRGIDIKNYRLPFIPFIHLGVLIFILLSFKRGELLF